MVAPLFSIYLLLRHATHRPPHHFFIPLRMLCVLWCIWVSPLINAVAEMLNKSAALRHIIYLDHIPNPFHYCTRRSLLAGPAESRLLNFASTRHRESTRTHQQRRRNEKRIIIGRMLRLCVRQEDYVPQAP